MASHNLTILGYLVSVYFTGTWLGSADSRLVAATNLAKMEDMRFVIQKVPFNISNAIDGVILSMEAVVAEKDIKLIPSICENNYRETRR